MRGMNIPYLRVGASLILAAFCGLAQANLVFAINEGVTYRVPNEEIRARYAAIAADLSKLLKQPVQIEPVADYKLLVVTKGFQDYKANFLVAADSPIKSLADLKGRKLGAPDEDSITSWMVRATIRDQVGDAKQVSYVYTRYQDAVPFFVENNLTPAGATAAGAVIKAWQAKGGKVLATSKAVPIKHVIASPKLPAEQAEAVRDYLLALDSTEEGRKKLEPTKWKGFALYDNAALMALGTWLGL
jgi:phosphonate transport system substrate-binding protein